MSGRLASHCSYKSLEALTDTRHPRYSINKRDTVPLQGDDDLVGDAANNKPVFNKLPESNSLAPEPMF